MVTHILRKDPSKDDNEWRFSVPPTLLNVRQQAGAIRGKLVSFSHEAIILQTNILFPMNRVLNTDDPSKYILASFAKLRFPETGPRVGKEYIVRLLKAGFFLNGIQYRFYHHSNSQLVGGRQFI